ncbi:LemA family protein [Erythrobacter arachoides]|uniref:LemA family protein n=1 Tax=Aurantiacibacter arachoides TaxID=1850444 RepID=A0A845A0K7_9SPHN|nr:LemA family protein [Aurantiacibacter arachoides]MXO93665.1 LemA family protein [Aurantiacibacter arachoides]GGD47629.1 LemA family lipoprotein [Aurantiacibacter arachoides]
MFKRLAQLATLAIGSLALASCGINSVPEKEEAARAQWGNVESALQRRADIIPNLVSTVQAAAVSEQNILTGVIEARSRATSINITTDDLSNPEEFQRFQDAQNQLTQALGQLRTIVEAYPDLQSNARFADLMVEIEQSNNMINTEVGRYNEAARDYNTEIRTFPSTIGANVIHGSEPMEYFEAAEGASENPEVEFNSINPAGGNARAPAATNDNMTGDRAAAAN